MWNVKFPAGYFRIKWKHDQDGREKISKQWVFEKPYMKGYSIIALELLKTNPPLKWETLTDKEVKDLIIAIQLQAVRDAISDADPFVRQDARRYLEKKEYELWVNIDLLEAYYKKLEKEMKKVIEYLNRYQRDAAEEKNILEIYNETIQRDEERIAVLRNKLILPSVASTGMPKSGNVTDRVGDIEAQIDEISREMLTERTKLLQKLSAIRSRMAAVIKQIEKITDDKLKALLISRYVKGMTWVQISEEMGYSEAYCKREMHLKALDEFYVNNKHLFLKKE